jgi:hypothetical protein
MNTKSKAVTRAQPFEAAELFSPRQRPRLPGQDPGIDLAREYAMARGMVGGEG